MKRKSFTAMRCPIARTLDHVGEWWSILILRDAMMGLSRFDEFQSNLGISPGMLSRRLRGLVESGLLDKRQYETNPPRMEYVLTERGKAFEPVLMAFAAFGSTHYQDPDRPVRMLVERKTGKPADLRLVDGVAGPPVTWTAYGFAEPAPASRVKAGPTRQRQ